MRRLLVLLALVAGTVCAPGVADAAPRWSSLASAGARRGHAGRARPRRSRGDRGRLYVLGGYDPR